MKRIVILVAFLSTAATAQTLVRDQFVPDGIGSFNIDYTVGQSFTVGLSGLMSAAEVLLASPTSLNPTDITFAIVPANADGSPPYYWSSAATVLQTRSLPDQSRRWERFTFTPFRVAAGEKYFIVIREDSGGLALRGYPYITAYPDLQDQYLPGEMWTMTSPSATWRPFIDRGADLSFATYVTPQTILSCIGFEAPFDGPLFLGPKSNKAIPIKLVLRDSAGLEVAAGDVSEPPVVQVSKGGQTGSEIPGYEADLLPSGLADDGNQFRYDEYSKTWILNLATKPYTASGTYTVTVVAGDDQYGIESCQQTFTR